MREAFNPEQLELVVRQLEEDGHFCSIFEGSKGLRSALSNSYAKLLVLGGNNAEITQLIEAIRLNSTDGWDVPILLCFREHLPEKEGLFLLPQIDDFLVAPFSARDVSLRVARLQQISTLAGDKLRSTKQNLISHFGIRQLVGQSTAFLSTVEKLPRIASCDAAVLLIGDTGTGKEMCARAIHYLSPRADKPFIPVNCGSIPLDLFENEMFGHEAGAFTDARQARRGLIAEAEGGTLLLDEIDSLPPLAQSKLLRFVQDREYKPLGASNYKYANTRLIAASNKDLHRMMQEGTFRKDLFYRLQVVSLHLPSLRERREDILPLAQHFLRVAASDYNRQVVRFSHTAMQKLIAYSWPGNVRELENVVRQAVVLSEKTVIRAHDLHLSTESSVASPAWQESFSAAKARVIEEFERNYLNEMVSVYNGNISRAARAAQKDRRAFFELLKKHGLTASRPREVEG